MRLRFAAAAICASLLLAGPTSAARIDIKHMTAEQLVDSPDFMEIHWHVPKNVVVIGPVEVTYCQEHKKDGPISEDQLTRMLKVAAARKGATALAKVSLVIQGPASDFCYSTSAASGIGYVHD